MFNIEKILSVITIVFCIVAITVMLFGLRAEIVIAAVSGIIALIALQANIQAGKETRKHNKLSVKPLLVVFRRINTQKSIGKYEVSVANQGVGPAIIKNVELLFEGKRVSLNDNITYKAFLNKKMKNLKSKDTFYPNPSFVIKMGETLILWSFEFDKMEAIYEMDKLGIKIEYKSMYLDKTFASGVKIFSDSIKKKSK